MTPEQIEFEEIVEKLKALDEQYLSLVSSQEKAEYMEQKKQLQKRFARLSLMVLNQQHLAMVKDGTLQNR